MTTHILPYYIKQALPARSDVTRGSAPCGHEVQRSPYYMEKSRGKNGTVFPNGKKFLVYKRLPNAVSVPDRMGMDKLPWTSCRQTADEFPLYYMEKWRGENGTVFPKGKNFST